MIPNSSVYDIWNNSVYSVEIVQALSDTQTLCKMSKADGVDIFAIVQNSDILPIEFGEKRAKLEIKMKRLQSALEKVKLQIADLEKEIIRSRG